jgi:uncharacterized membrane protein YesL
MHLYVCTSLQKLSNNKVTKKLIYIDIHIHIHIYVSIHIFIEIFIYICIYMYLFTYMYVYEYVSFQKSLINKVTIAIIAWTCVYVCRCFPYMKYIDIDMCISMYM